MKKLEVKLNVTIGQLRKEIANAFHLPFGGFQMGTKTRIFDREDDDTQYHSLGWCQQITIKKYVNDISEDPKLTVAQNHSYINYLFLLLSKESAPYVELVWELLVTLPTNQKIANDIKALEVPPATEVSLNPLIFREAGIICWIRSLFTDSCTRSKLSKPSSFLQRI